MKKSINLDRINNYIIPLLSILSIYRVFTEGISVADIFMVIFIIYFLFSKKFKYRDLAIIICLFFYLFVSLIFSYINIGYFYQSSVLIRFGKTFIYVIYALFSIRYSLNKMALYKSFKIIGNLIYFGLSLQYAFFLLFNRYLLLKIPFLNYINDEINSVDFGVIRTLDFRPSSFYLEPAHLALFIIVHLFVVLLHKKDLDRNHLIYAGLITVFGLLTTSSTALIILPVIWIYYFLFIYKNGLPLKKILGLLFFGFLAYLILQFSFINNALYRVLDINSIVVTGRVFAGIEIINNLSSHDLIFGVGFGNVLNMSYMNSYLNILYYLGKVGMGIFILTISFLFIRSNRGQKLVIAIFIILMFASPIIISINILNFMILFAYTSNLSVFLGRRKT